VLRALVSAAYAERLPRVVVEPLLEKLRELPRYRLPYAVDAHTRHYMPDGANQRGKVFDAFVAVEGGAQNAQPLLMAWPAVLTTDERELLARLCRRITYLGRAESWADLEVVDVNDDHWDCWPDEWGQGAGETTLLALETQFALEEWAKNQPKPKKGPDVPRDLWSVLTFEGERYRAEGWNAVPGTRLVRYVFARSPFRRAAVPSFGRRSTLAPTVARFAIRSSVLPKIQDAISVGERLRQSAMSHSNRVRSGGPSDVFSGHGDAATKNHGHAMYLATSDLTENRLRGRIDHLLISARAGFDDHDVLALQSVRKLWGHGGHDLHLMLVGLGTPSDFGGIASPCTPILAESRTWESITPFVPTRHPKEVRGVEVDTIQEQIARGCEQLIGIRPVSVSPAGDAAAWLRFRRRRLQGAGRRGPDRAVGARLVFDRPVRGPIALGYGAHFGLGLFIAVNNS
jgi:CRISPR-associated protein Csb2